MAAHRLELGADQAGAVGPAELLAEEAELGGAVAVAGGGALGVGEAAAASLLEAEAELDVLGAGHVRVEGADAVDHVAAVGGVGGDRVGGVGVEGEALPVAEQAGGLALGRRRGGDVLEVAGDGADLRVLEGADQLGEPLRLDQAVGVDEGEDLAGALGDAAVAGVGDAGLRLAEVADRACLDLGGGAVGGAVVDDEDLAAVGRVVGGEDRVDAVGDRGLAVADGDDHGDGWLVGLRPRHGRKLAAAARSSPRWSSASPARARRTRPRRSRARRARAGGPRRGRAPRMRWRARPRPRGRMSPGRRPRRGGGGWPGRRGPPRRAAAPGWRRRRAMPSRIRAISR